MVIINHYVKAKKQNSYNNCMVFASPRPPLAPYLISQRLITHACSKSWTHGILEWMELGETDVACWYESRHPIASHNTCAMLQHNQGIDGIHGHDINLAIM